MLMGFSFENELKGYSLERYFIIKPDSGINSFDEILKNVWQTKNGHELKKIALSCGIQLYNAEQDLLDRYEKFLVWAGRYFFPISDKPFEKNNLKFYSGDEETYNRLILRIRNNIEQERRNIKFE
jgi:hypothetical protein